MTTYYWIGDGSLNDWSSGNTWSLSSGGSTQSGRPGSSDTAIFDANSTNDCLPSGAVSAAVINFTGYTHIFQFSSTVTVSTTLTLASGMSYASIGGTTVLGGTSSATVTCAGKSLGATNVNGVGATWTVQDTFKATTLTFVNGTLSLNNLNGHVITTLTHSGTATRALTIGTSQFQVNGSATLFSVGFTISASAGAKLTMAGGTVTLTGGVTLSNLDIAFTGASGTATFASGGTYNNLTVTRSSGTTFYPSAAVTVNTFTMTGGGQTLKLPNSANVTCSHNATDALSIVGTQANHITILSDNSGVDGFFALPAQTFTQAIKYANMTDVRQTGATAAHAVGCQNVSNNVGWIFDYQSFPADTLGATDNNHKAYGFGFAEAAGITDGVTADTPTIVRSATDRLALADTGQFVAETPDQLAILDSATIARGRTFAEAFGLTDLVSYVKAQVTLIVASDLGVCVDGGELIAGTAFPFDTEVGIFADNGFLGGREPYAGARSASTNLGAIARGDTFDLLLTNIRNDVGDPIQFMSGDRLGFTMKWAFSRADDDTILAKSLTISQTVSDATFSIVPSDWHVSQLARTTTAVWDVSYSRNGDPSQVVTLAKGTIRIYADAVLVTP
jgi:hypothetical protein